MARYSMEMLVTETNKWESVGYKFNTKAQLDFWLEGDDFSPEPRGTRYYEWRVGYVWKPYDSKYTHRFVWGSGSKVGQEVKV